MMAPKAIVGNLRDAGMIKGAEFKALGYEGPKDQQLAVSGVGKKQMQVATQLDAVSALALFNTPHRFGTQQKALPGSQ